MLRVGLTGGIGSGKSTAAKLLAGMGAQLSQSDEVGRALMEPGQPAYAAIVQHFGDGVLNRDATLDRARLAQFAFAEGRLEELNSLVHPLVIRAQAAWVESVAARDPRAVAVVESALIFETRYGRQETSSGTVDAPWRTRFDRIVVVTAPVELRKARYLARLRVSEPKALAEAAADFDRRSQAQWSDEFKCALADHVLHNDGSVEELEPQVGRLWDALRQESYDRALSAV